MEFKRIMYKTYILFFILMVGIQSSQRVMAATNTSNIYLTVGEKSKLPKEVRKNGYTYKTSNYKVLQVSDKGKLHAKRIGNVKITAIYNNGVSTYKYKIRVHEKVKNFKWLNKTDHISIGEEYKCVIGYKVKSKKNIAFKWDSSDKKVAVVSQKGIIKGIGKGETIISCNVQGQKKAKISFKLKVMDNSVQTIRIDDNNKTINKFTLNNLHNGDAKFFGDSIITSIGGKLNIFGLDGTLIKRYDNIKTNWISSLKDERIIVYGNSDKKIGIVSLDENFNVVSNKIILKSNNLLIDPTINKIEGKYYITVTEIEGTVNNSNPSNKNGEYRIHLYVSDNLTIWKYITDIEQKNNNLEDIDIVYNNNILYAVYEVEELDKGNSSIVIRSSEDEGKTWSDSKILLKADCDHEPVGLYKHNDKYVICYSCDKEDVGKSYMGASAYYSVFDENWNLIEKDHMIDTECQKGILWYDYMILDNKEYFLFAKDYFTSCDMVLEWR